MSFIHDDFLLKSDPARELYHKHAEPMPIFDYHSHMPPDEIAINKVFENMGELWLGEDHYKWRAMRANGIPEKFITGDGSHREKFDAFVKTVPAALRNPLYHWSHLELKRYFDMDILVSEKTGDEIWEKCGERLHEPGFSAHGILDRFNVKLVCTTDDPADPLDHHEKIKATDLKTKVYPTFRPDGGMMIMDADRYQNWIKKMSSTSGIDIGDLAGLQSALEKRHQDFHDIGCRLSDGSFRYAYSEDCSHQQAQDIFSSVLAGKDGSREQQNQFSAYLLHFLGELDAGKGWTRQLHLGPMRNNNSRIFNTFGPDAGTDSIGDYNQSEPLSRYLDKLDVKDKLPKTILYNLNPKDNYMMATMAGNFQDPRIHGKIQYGSGWWFLDQKQGMEMQIDTLSNCGLLSHFVGMTTDSRSFLSYTRHEYFRRTLCNLLGEDVVNGELPDDMDVLGKLVEDVCYNNAVGYFGLEL